MKGFWGVVAHDDPFDAKIPLTSESIRMTCQDVYRKTRVHSSAKGDDHPYVLGPYTQRY